MQIVGLFVGLFVALAAAENGWRVKQEYTFAIEGRSLAGIPQLKHQYSGVHFRGNLRVQSQHAALLVMELRNMTFTKMHANMEKGWWHPIPNTDEELKRFQDLPMTGNSFVARIEQGKVARIVVNSKTPAWEINFIQAIASHLQQNTEAKPEGRRARPSDNQPMDIYTVMEDSIVGRCPVMYEISPLAKALVSRDNPQWVKMCGKDREFMEVIKTWNYTNCEHLAESNYGIPNMEGCTPGGNECGRFWSRSSLTRTVGCGKRNDMMRLNTISSSQILSSLRLQPQVEDLSKPRSQASLGTYLNMTLISVQPQSKRITPPTNPVAIDGIKYQAEAFATDDQDEDASSHPQARKPRAIKRKSKKRNPSKDDNESQEEQQESSENSEEMQVKKKEKKKKADSSEEMQVKKKDKKKKADSSEEVEWSTMRPLPSSEESSDDSIPHEKTKKSKKHKAKNSSEKNSLDSDEDTSESSLDQPPVLPFSPFALAHQDNKARACLVQQFKEIVQDITKSLDPQGSEIENIEKIQLAVQMCRSMTYSDLNTAVNTVIEDRSDKSALLTKHKLLRDIVMMCGSNPSFLMIKNWIETGVIQGEEAAQVLAALPSYQLKPSRKMLNKFFEMVRGEIGNRDQKVTIAAVIAFSHMLRITCAAQQKERIYTKECQPQVQKYLSFLNEKAKSSKGLRPVYMTALGNAGFADSLPLLAAMAKDQHATPYQRVSAIVAMRHLVFIEPQETRRVLLKLYHTNTHPNSVRVAAVSMLMYARPTLATWQRLAVSTWYEPSAAVKTFVYSSIRSIAASKDPVYQEMAKNAATVLPLVMQVPLGPSRPYNLIRSTLTKDVDEVISEQISWSLDPFASNLYFRQVQRLGGLSKLQFESDLWMADADGMLILMNDLLFRHKNVKDARPEIPNLPFTTSWIRSTLNIATRALPQIEGHLSFKLGNLHQRFLPFDSKSVPYLEQVVRKFIEEYKFGQEILYQKHGHQSLWISTVTEVGLPAEFKIDIPWMFRGKTLTDAHQSRGIFASQVEAMASTEFTSELSVFTPHDCMRYVAGINSFTTFQLPLINLSIQKMQGARLNFSFTPLHENVETLLFSQNSTPYTAQQDMLSLMPLSTSNVAAKIKISPEIKLKSVSGSTDSFRLEYASEAPNHRWAPEPNWLMNYPSLWQGIESSELKIYANRPSPLSALLSMRQAKMENGEITMINNTSPTSRRYKTTPTMPPMMAETTTEMPTTTYGSTTTTEYTTPMYSTTPDSDISMSDSEEGQPDNYTRMERLDKIKIISANVEDPIGLFNASQIDLTTAANVSMRQEFLLTKILTAMESGQATVLSVAFAVNHSDVAQYQSFFIMGQGRAKEYHRMGAFFIDDVDKYQAAISGVVSTPRVPLLKLKNLMEVKLNSTIMVDMRVSNNKDINDIISLQGLVTRTEEQKNYIYNHTYGRDCLKSGSSVQPECYRLLQKAAFLDRYNVSVNYNEGARRHGLSAQHYFGIAKHILFPHLSGEDFAPDVIPTEAPERMIKVIAEIHPQTQSASLWMRTPTEETEFNSIPLHGLLHQTFRINPIMGFASRFRDSAFCSMDERKFVTFDRSKFNYKLSSNWHVMAKDCSGRSRFVILARIISNRTEVMVNLDNYKVIHFMPGSALVDGVRIDLNREQMAETYDLAGNQLFELTYTDEKAFDLRLPAHGLSVIYHNTVFLIQPSALLRGRMCGICGNFNGQMEDDFSVPSGSMRQEGSDFAKSWALPSH